MKLHILSDLHTEFADFDPPATGADVVILAGDIGVGDGGVDWAAGRFPTAPVIYVPGNHEYFEHDIAHTAALRSHSRGNVHVLQCAGREIGGVRFLGCTLWTDFRYYGAETADTAMRNARSYILDYTWITNDGAPFTPDDSVRLHEAAKAWLVGQLAEPFDGPTVVVTHHLPAAPSVSPRFHDVPSNPAFVSRLEDIIERYRPALWVHGHTHEPCDYELFGTRVVCNPRGYPREGQWVDFRPDLVVTV
jgi:Icc-related predicted phosphoesterase